MIVRQDRYLQFSPGYPYLRVRLSIWNAPGLEYTAIEKLLMPFSSNVWIALLTVFTVSIIVTILLHFIIPFFGFFDTFMSKTYSPTMTVVSLFLSGSSVWKPIRLSARLLFATLLFSIMILQNSYQGSLFEFLQSQTRTQLLDTVDKLMQHNYDIYAFSSQLMILNFNISSLPKK